jgi:hypothetical protein
VNPASWTDAELDRIGAAEKLELATLRRDGTPRYPVTICWVVRHGDDLYVRSWRGRDGGWYRAARARGEGHISAGGVVKDVAFANADHDLDEIDAAYREKYGRYASYVRPMIGPEARETTLRLAPRS